MKILCISDTHDIVAHMEHVLEEASPHKYEAIIHAGDLVSPSSLDVFSSTEVPIYYAMGNNEEGYEELLLKKAEEMGIHFSVDVATFTLDGKNIAITHYPRVAERLSMFNQFDLICFGHSHIPLQEKVGSTLLLNPGNLAGWRHTPTYAIYDTKTHTATIYDLHYRRTHYSFPEA